MSSPATHPTPERIFEALNAYQKTEALKTAVELGLFTAIDEGADTAEKLAERVQASLRGVRILADYLTVHEFLRKENGVYSLSPDAAAFLSGRSPAYLGGMTKFLVDRSHREYFADLTQTVRTGRMNLGGTVTPDNRMWVEFARQMVPMMMPSAVHLPNLTGDLPTGARILDIAAGHGMFGIQFALRHPEARIHALDWPAVLEVAVENAEKANVASRLHLIPGDAFSVAFGSDYDVALITNFLHHFDYATCVDFLKKVRAAVKPGGAAVTLEFVPNEDRISPRIEAQFALQMLGDTPGGDAYTFRELESMFRDAGFPHSTLHDIPMSPQHAVVSR